MRVTDIHEIYDTLQPVESTAELTATMAWLEAEIDDDDDDGLYDDTSRQRNKETLINNDSGDLHSGFTDADSLEFATQNRLMREMLLENQAQWKAEQRLEQVGMLPKL